MGFFGGSGAGARAGARAAGDGGGFLFLFVDLVHIAFPRFLALLLGDGFLGFGFLVRSNSEFGISLIKLRLNSSRILSSLFDAHLQFVV